jgi:glycosyltransferase involved in cell wall biosynthesis
LPDPRRKFGSPRYWSYFATDLVDVQTDRVVLREERRAALEWDVILCNSFFSRESILRAYGIDARVCYLGIDTSSFSPGTREPMNYLLGLGGLYAAKGAHLIIASLAEIPAAIRPSLKWVGNFAESSYRRACEELARKHGVDFTCEVRVSEDVLLERLQLALALVYPSVLEPFGYAPLEANACGTPVLGIAEGGVRETVEDGVNGLLVRDRQPKSWAAAIQRLLQTPGLRASLATQSIELVRERWSAKAAIVRLEKELEMAARSGRRKTPSPSVLAVQ